MYVRHTCMYVNIMPVHTCHTCMYVSVHLNNIHIVINVLEIIRVSTYMYAPREKAVLFQGPE